MLLVAMEYTDMHTDHKHGIILEIAVKSEEQRPSKIKVFEPWWSKIGWIESIESEHFGIFTTSKVRHLAPNFFAWNTLKTHRPTLRDIDSAISNKNQPKLCHLHRNVSTESNLASTSTSFTSFTSCCWAARELEPAMHGKIEFACNNFIANRWISSPWRTLSNTKPEHTKRSFLRW